MQTQSIDTAPAGDGWILGLLPPNARERLHFGVRWVICTRCDTGWHDDDGYDVQPTHWAALPDPQPEGTGWSAQKPGSYIEIVAARGLNHDWVGWLVSFVHPDGTHDNDRDPSFEDSPEAARATAARWSAIHGLEVREGPMDHAAVVIPFPTKDRG